MNANLFTDSPCPHCGGSGKQLDLKAIRRLIEKSGKSERHYAVKLSINPGYFNQMLNGHRPFPSDTLFQLIALTGARLQLANTD